MNRIFITGTDTGVGKTYVTCTLLQALNAQNYKTLGLKPIASGCSLNQRGKLINDDAVALQKAASVKCPYEYINPIPLAHPIAPHLAAEQAQTILSVSQVKNKISRSLEIEADFQLIEGVGGWAVPLNGHELLSDLVAALKLPVILVVGIKLGCLNHALLTYQRMRDTQVPIIGWIANCIDPGALAIQENIDTLKQWINVPCLGVLPFSQTLNPNGLEIQKIIHYFERVASPAANDC